MTRAEGRRLLNIAEPALICAKDTERWAASAADADPSEAVHQVLVAARTAVKGLEDIVREVKRAALIP